MVCSCLIYTYAMSFEGLQLKEYTDVFKKSGWDRIDYLDDMNRDDLKHMGINDSLLQQRILNSIADMKKQ